MVPSVIPVILPIFCLGIIGFFTLTMGLKLQNKLIQKKITEAAKELNIDIDKYTPEAFQNALNKKIEEYRAEYNSNLEAFKAENGIIKIENTILNEIFSMLLGRE